jgi:hypothetical protein
MAAVRWSLLFSPAFGAWLHAINWQEINEPRLARANMLWVWGTMVFLVLNAATIFFPLPRTAEAVSRMSGILLWAAWYWAQGQAQVQYVKDYGGHYVKKGWARPLLIAVAAIALYFLTCVALVYATLPSAPKSRDPAVLAAWLEPRILNKWHESPKLHDAAIEKLVLDHQDGGTYTGVVEATFGGKPERLAVTLIIGDDGGFEWKLKGLHDDQGKPPGK